MKRKVIIIVIVFLVLLGLIGILVPIMNNRTAKKIENRLSQISIPENTEFMESLSSAGKLTGNGNGMQYFGAVLLKSELSLEELVHYYEVYSENEWDCLVEVQNSQQVKVIEHKAVLFETALLPGEKYYIVYSWGEGVLPFSELDLRGH